MNLRLFNILPNPHNNTCQVIVEGDDQFHSLFQWQRELAQKVYELVAQVYNQKPLDFPIILGEFDTSQSQKLFLLSGGSWIVAIIDLSHHLIRLLNIRDNLH